MNEKPTLWNISQLECQFYANPNTELEYCSTDTPNKWNVKSCRDYMLDTKFSLKDYM